MASAGTSGAALPAHPADVGRFLSCGSTWVSSTRGSNTDVEALRTALAWSCGCMGAPRSSSMPCNVSVLGSCRLTSSARRGSSGAGLHTLFAMRAQQWTARVRRCLGRGSSVFTGIRWQSSVFCRRTLARITPRHGVRGKWTNLRVPARVRSPVAEASGGMQTITVLLLRSAAYLSARVDLPWKILAGDRAAFWATGSSYRRRRWASSSPSPACWRPR
jgi:hypothetical protein